MQMSVENTTNMCKSTKRKKMINDNNNKGVCRREITKQFIHHPWKTTLNNSPQDSKKTSMSRNNILIINKVIDYFDEASQLLMRRESYYASENETL